MKGTSGITLLRTTTLSCSCYSHPVLK